MPSLGGAGRLSGKTDAARSGDDDRPDARPAETAVLSLDVLGGERGVLSFMVFQGRLRLIRMLGYCLELNPDELLNPDVKTNDPGKSRPTHRSTSSWAVCAVISTGGRSTPPVIRSFFQEQPVRYAAWESTHYYWVVGSLIIC